MTQATLSTSTAERVVGDSPTFTFTPRGDHIECASFSVPFKMLAVAIVTLVLAWAWQMWSNGLLEWTLASSGWLGAAVGMMAYTEWHILKGRTSLNSTTLKQSWVWQKRVALSDLAYAKLIRLRGFDWLIAPRLYTKTFSNKLAVFYAASPAMLIEFQRLEQDLKSARDSARSAS